MQLKVLLFFQVTIGNQALQIKRCRLIHCELVRLCWLIVALFLVHLEQILMGLKFLILGTIEGETHDADDLYKISVKRDQMFYNFFQCFKINNELRTLILSLLGSILCFH